MTNHLLTMHTVNDGERLWLTCSCGFGTEPIEVETDEQYRSIQAELVTLGRAHIEAAEGGEA